MNRILALQGLSTQSTGFAEVSAESGQSNNCSSATTACSTQSSFCKSAAELAW